MTKKTLLLVSSVPEDQGFGTKVAEIADLDLIVEPDIRKAVARIGQGVGDVIFVDGSTEQCYREFETVVRDSLGLFSDRINANVIHWISTLDLQQVSYLFQSPIFGNYINRSYGNTDEAGTRYGFILRAALKDRAFGLENLLPDGTKIQTIKFESSRQKQEAVEAVKNFLIAAKFKSRMATVIANAVDELVMNAMFDAPVDQLGKQIYASTPRDTELKLEGRAAVEMRVGFDRHYVAISAVDSFGSLDKLKLFNHISKRYVEEEYKVRTSTAGAGIGLATVFRSGGSFFFTSEKSVRTEVTVFFKRTDNFREFKDQFRFISTQFYF